MVEGKTHKSSANGKYLKPDEISLKKGLFLFFCTYYYIEIFRGGGVYSLTYIHVHLPFF